MIVLINLVPARVTVIKSLTKPTTLSLRKALFIHKIDKDKQ